VLRPIDANEARYLMCSGPTVDQCLEEIYDLIRKYASRKDKEMSILTLEPYPAWDVENELRSKGFTVETRGKDPNGVEPPNMNIRWGW
jgi:hypothetical protein